MSELEKLLLWAAAAIAVIYLIGSSAVRRITKAVAQWLAVILVLIWGFQGSILAY
jgi:hypothetical protein